MDRGGKMQKKMSDRLVRSRAMDVDYRNMVSMPIRDMDRDGEIAFVVDVYGVMSRDLAIIPGGSRPMMKAVERLGLDSSRFRAEIWDLLI
jgi:hypothetical protein